MATTTNYGWTTPDDTALVKDGASAIRTLGTSVDTTTKNLNPSTTLGDIEYRSSTANTNTRLGIGSTGNVLTVTGGVPVWAAPAGGGSNFTLLNSGGTALTGAATITVSGISSKDKIMVLLDDANGDGLSIIGIRLNTDTASNYYNYGWFQTASSGYSSSDQGNTFSAAASSVTIGKQATSAGTGVSGGILLNGCNASGVKIYQSYGSGARFDGDNFRAYWTNGYYNSASTISSISVISSIGNFTSGTVYVYTSA